MANGDLEERFGAFPETYFSGGGNVHVPQVEIGILARTYLNVRQSFIYFADLISDIAKDPRETYWRIRDKVAR